MSVGYNPKIVTDGLVLCLDAGNSKSYNSAENLIKYSQKLNTSPWNKYAPNSNITVTENNITAPDGTLTGNKITDSNNANGGSVWIDVPGISGTGTYTVSIFVKAGTASTVGFGMYFLSGGTTQGYFPNFNITTGTFTSGTGTVVAYDNGWYRISVTNTGTDAANTVLRLEMYQQATGYVYAWGAQVNTGPYVRPYTVTTDNVVAATTNWSGIFPTTQVAESVNTPIFDSSSSASFSFNGTTNSRYFKIQNDTTLDTDYPSIEVWVKPTSLNQNGFWFEKGTVNTQYSLFQEGTYICFRTKPSGTYDSLYGASSVLSTTAWNHVVAVKTTAEKIIYINGVKVYSKSYTDPISTTTGGMSIGVYGGYAGSRSYYYNGNISSVKIYNRSLSANEVFQNFNAMRGRFGV